MSRKTEGSVKTFLIVLLMLAALGMIGCGVYFIFFANKDAYDRQKEEGAIADEYIDDLILKLQDPIAYESKVAAEVESKRAKESQEAAEREKNGGGDGMNTNNPANPSAVPAETAPNAAAVPSSDLNYEDNNYYSRDGVIYTPEYAKGRIDCVLEVPTARIRRGVYTGTWEEILYDLDIWMVTVANPDYRLGETHYCIYGHNHTAQDLSFNNLKEVQVGDMFYLTAESGRYEYDVTNVFAVARESATNDYVNNFSIGSDKCYIVTCGRDENRYLDLIVEGTLKRHISLLDYDAERKAQQ